MPTPPVARVLFDRTPLEQFLEPTVQDSLFALAFKQLRARFAACNYTLTAEAFEEARKSLGMGHSMLYMCERVIVYLVRVHDAPRYPPTLTHDMYTSAATPEPGVLRIRHADTDDKHQQPAEEEVDAGASIAAAAASPRVGSGRHQGSRESRRSGEDGASRADGEGGAMGDAPSAAAKGGLRDDGASRADTEDEEEPQHVEEEDDSARGEAAAAGAEAADAETAPMLGASLGRTVVSGSLVVAPLPMPAVPQVLSLERVPGTLLDVYWSHEGTTFPGVVEKTQTKGGVSGIVVYYPVDETLVWHDFGTDGCTFTVVEPPMHLLDQIRRLADGSLEGKLAHPNHGRIYKLTAEDVVSHFDDPEINERAWLDALPVGGGFRHMPAGRPDKGKARKKPVKEPVQEPPKELDCVPGSLSKAFALAGDAEAAAIVMERKAAILAAEGRKGDRIKYAAEDVVKPLCHYKVGKLKVTCALQVDPSVVCVMLLKSVDGTCRQHAVATYGGMLHDSAQPEPLGITPENLSQCLGVEYGGVVRGYWFEKQAVKRKREGSDGSSKVARM